MPDSIAKMDKRAILGPYVRALMMLVRLVIVCIFFYTFFDGTIWSNPPKNPSSPLLVIGPAAFSPATFLHDPIVVAL